MLFGPPPARRRLTALRHLALPGLAAWPVAAMTQAMAQAVAPTASPPPAAASAPAVQQVQIQGQAAADARQNELTTRIVIPREALLKFGDSSLRDALRRVPGVTVDSEVRLRGLGSGYTQILIDGTPAPTGFTIDSLDPALIERIEILHAPAAEHSLRGIAGSINLVLRQRITVAQRGLTLAVAHSQYRTGAATLPSASLQWSQRRGALDAQLVASLSRPEARDTATVDDRSERATATAATAGEPATLVSARHTTLDWVQRSQRWSLAPRLVWKAGAQAVTTQWLLQRDSAPAHWTMREERLAGEPSAYPLSDWRNLRSVTRTLRADLAWTRPLGERAQLEVKLGLHQLRRDTDFDFQGFASDAARQSGQATLDRQVHSNALDQSVPLKGKFSTDLGDDHRLALGWDGAWVRRREQRQQRDADAAGQPVYALDQDYTAQVQQLALFAQDEWTVRPRLQLYLGLRWETLRTRVDGLGFHPVQQRSSVPSPVLQLLWQRADRPKDQWRLALSRSYKAPTPASLVPRRYTVNNGNGPANPDVEGNPGLRPELAWGMDLAYESTFAPGAFWSLSAHARQIDDVVLRRLYQDGNEWVSTQANGGRAQVYGWAWEIKAPWPAWVGGAAGPTPWTVNANLAWNRSRVQGLPGPHNVLASQVPASAGFGLDGALSPAWTLGGQWTWRAPVQALWMADAQAGVWTMRDSASRTLDLYALWKLAPRTQLRITAANLLQPTRHETTRIERGAEIDSRQFNTDSRASLRLQWEMPI